MTVMEIEKVQDDWQEQKKEALAYGTLVALVWGIVISLSAFYAPLTMSWAHWCGLLVGGIAVSIGLAWLAVTVLRWSEAWRAARQHPAPPPAA
jgi:uncharacterized transporter YbjL